MPWWRRGLPLAVTMAVAAAASWFTFERLLVDRRPILIGILHARTGPLASSERSMIDAETLAIEQINEAGGLLGRPVRWVIADGGDDRGIDGGAVARRAERLIRDERVDVLIGCGTSSDRRSVLPVIEQSGHILLHPGSSEGFEQSPAVIYTGAVANQHVAPAVQWCHEALSARRYLLVGSDDVWPRCINAIASDQIRGVGGKVVGECTLPRGGIAMDEAVDRVVALHPDVVLCSLAGDAAAAFFVRLRAAGVHPQQTPVVAFALSEEDLNRLDIDDVVGHYAAAGYFQSIERPENLAFVRAFKARFGEGRATAADVVAAYDSVRLWAQAVQEAQTTDVRQVREALRHQSRDAPGGIIAVDPDSQHTWRPVFIGRVRDDGQFEIVWSTRTAVRPVPFPLSRPRSAWDTFVDGLYRESGGRWPRSIADGPGGDRPR